MIEIHAPPSDDLSRELSPRQPDAAGCEVEIADGSAGPAEPVVAAPTSQKPKKKRAPRPTFEDGSLTRVFKFPSKKYPKSSYYVTDTEIIIRIKKARKKWKLILPKKRVVSCRTNRWFTKPRWIEIELTYTQAVRQGLHEPNAQPVRLEAPEASRAAPLPVLPVELKTEGSSPLASTSEATTGVEAAGFSAPGSDAAGISAEKTSEIEVDADNDPESDVELGTDEVAGWVPDDDADLSTSEDPSEADDEYQTDDPPDEAYDLVIPQVCASADDPEGDAPPVAAEPDDAPAAPPDTTATIVPALIEDHAVTTPPAAFEAPEEITLATIFDRPFDEAVATLSDAPPIETREVIEAPAVGAPETPDRLPPIPPIHFPVREKPKRRYLDARLLAASLALAMLSVTADWSQMADSTADNGACVNVPHPACENYAIVTGSIDVAAASRSADAESPVEANAEIEMVEAVRPANVEQSFPAAIETTAVADEPSTPNSVAGVSPDDTPSRTVELALNAEPVASAPAAPAPAQPSPPEPVMVPVEAETPRPIVRSAGIELCPVRASSIAKSTVVQFGFASATLPALGVEPLDELASTLKRCPAVHVMIEGHTDSDGDYYRNQSLSVRRAEAVRQHLVSAGVGLSQLSIIGFGQIRPLAPNDSANNKSRNRRIELVVQ